MRIAALSLLLALLAPSDLRAGEPVVLNVRDFGVIYRYCHGIENVHGHHNGADRTVMTTCRRRAARS